MSKGEFPPFRMTIEAGRLVPASAHDAERLDSYRRGTVVYVRFTEEKDRVLVRKWWAILGLVVKQCQTPWKTKEEASEAIKLALGIVNLSKTVGGQFMQYPKSLTELTDPELQEAVEQMMELIHHLTGVDPETLRKETAHIVDHEPPHDAETGEILDNSNPGEVNPSASPVDDVASSAASAGEDDPLPSSPAQISDDERAWLLTVARMLWGCVPETPSEETLVVLNNQRLAAGEFKPEPLGDEARLKAGSIYKRCKECVEDREKYTRPATLKYIAGIAGCNEQQIEVK